MLGLVVLVAIAGVISYNRFVTQKNLIKDAWANIDTELRRRYDLIPNLVETVKGYATHEREVFEEVTRARASAAGATGSPAAQAAAEGPFMAALGKLFAVAEAYPDLKANENFLALQTELSNTEDRLQTARRFYNANVRTYNTRLAGVPVLDHRRHVPLRTRRVLRDPGHDPARRVHRRSTSRRLPPIPWRRRTRRLRPRRQSRRRPHLPRRRRRLPRPPRVSACRRATGVPGVSYASGGGPPHPSNIVARRTSVVSHIHTAAHTTAIPPMITAVMLGSKTSASQPVSTLDVPNVSVTNIPSNAKMRPRMWSGTIFCNPYEESIHWAPPPVCASATAGSARSRLGTIPSNA